MNGVAPAAAAARPRQRLVEPGRFWIRHVPRSWPGAEGLWVDLAGAGLGTPGLAAERLPELASFALDDVVYLPPVPPRLVAARTDLAAALVESGTPVLLQLLRGEVAAADSAGVYDLLPDLLDGDLAALAELPRGSCAVWPLVSGVTDLAEMWERGCACLAAAGVAVVQPLVLALDPVARRRLGDACPAASFERLFHALQPSEQEFSIVAWRHGLRPFLERPLPSRGISPPLVNRRVAAALALTGELWLRLERDEAPGQELLAAARRLDRLPHDLTVLAREGNLGLLDWLGGRGRALVEQSLSGAPAQLPEELLAEYLQAEPGR